MTRPEITSKRDLTFSQWIRKKLPDSKSGFMVTDIDFFIFNYKTKKCMVVEVKTRNTEIKDWQRIFYTNFDKWLKTGVMDGWTYRGAYLVKFENTCFEDGKCYLTSFEKNETMCVTERALIKFLSLNEN